MSNKINWELINPEGVIQTESRSANPHPSSLEGKTVLLRWNGKHNGDVLLDRIAELLIQRVKKIKILKAWEILPESANSSQNVEVSQKMATKLAELGSDIVIVAQSD